MYHVLLFYLFIYICVDHVTSHKKDSSYHIFSTFIICPFFLVFLFYFIFYSLGFIIFVGLSVDGGCTQAIHTQDITFFNKKKSKDNALNIVP